MNLKSPMTKSQLRKKYHKMALLRHPDKKGDPKDFLELQEAYIFLSLYIENEIKSENETKRDDEILSSFIQIFSTLSSHNGENSNIATKIRECVEKYSGIIGINKKTLSSIVSLFDVKRTCEYIVINTSIENLLNSELYKLEHCDVVFYVPLWHTEVTYNFENVSIVVECVPQLPSHMSIDVSGNLHINVATTVAKVFDNGCIEIHIGSQTHIVSSKEIFITRHQQYVMKKKGFPAIDTNNIYDASHKCDVIIHLTLI